MSQIFENLARPVMGAIIAIGLSGCGNSEGSSATKSDVIAEADCIKPLPPYVMTPGVRPELEAMIVKNPNHITSFFGYFHQMRFVEGLPLSSIEYQLNMHRTSFSLYSPNSNLHLDLDDSFSVEPEEVVAANLNSGALRFGRKTTYDISAADRDGDGTLSRLELFQDARLRVSDHKMFPGYLFYLAMASFDADGDNILTHEELEDAVLELAYRLDLPDVELPSERKLNLNIKNIPDGFNVASVNIETIETAPCLPLHSPLAPLPLMTPVTELAEYYRERFAGEFSSEGRDGKVFDGAFYARGELGRMYSAYINQSYNEGMPIQAIEFSNNQRRYGQIRLARSALLSMDINGDLQVSASEVQAFKTYLPQQFEKFNLKYWVVDGDGASKDFSEVEILEKSREFGGTSLPVGFFETEEAFEAAGFTRNSGGVRAWSHYKTILDPHLNYIAGFDMNGDGLLTLEEVNAGLSEAVKKNGLEETLSPYINSYSSPKYVRGTNIPMPEDYRKALGLDSQDP